MAKFYALCEMENSKPEIYYRILNEAMTLIKKHGIRFVTMDLIAENLGISKKTIYVHFRNKKSLISETVKKRLEEQEIAFEEIDRKSKNIIETMVMVMDYGASKLDEINPIAFEELKRFYPDLFSSMQNSRKEINHQNTIKMIEIGKKEELFREDVHEDIASRLFLAQMELMMDHQVFPAMEYSKGVLFKHICINFLRGISTSDGLRVLENLSSQKTFQDKIENEQ